MTIMKEFKRRCEENFWYYPKYVGVRIFTFFAWYLTIASDYNFFGRY